MRLELRNNKDFWAGMMFFGTGAGAMTVARHYPFGTTLNMGPGYFPKADTPVLKRVHGLDSSPHGALPKPLSPS